METELYKQVFQACEPDEEGFISIKNLANISRSHVETGDVDRILGIFNTSKQDRLNFADFCDHITNFMDENKNKENLWRGQNSGRSPPDIRITSRSFQTSNGNSPTAGDTSSSQFSGNGSPHSDGQLSGNSSPGGQQPPRVLGDNLSHKRKMSKKNSKSRVSQTRLTGHIPLVNTSSEDEQDLEEDSFDRKIAEELEFAGKQLETSCRLPARTSPPRFLVRGSNARSTLRSKSSGRLPFTPLLISESPHKTAALSPISSANSSMQPQQFDDSVATTLSRKLEDDMNSTTVTNNMLSRHSSPINRSDKERKADLTETKELITTLAVKLTSLESFAGDTLLEPTFVSGETEFHDSLESQTNKMKMDADMTLRKVRENHREEIRAISRERELEVSNYKLRLEQLQTELDRLTKEKSDLNEKVRLLFMEKEASEDTVLRLQEDVARLEDEARATSGAATTVTARSETSVEVRDNTRERIAEVSKMSLGSDQMSTTESYESEYLTKIQQLASRIQEQDDFIQELKEDNLVLRNQKRSLLDAFNNEKNRKSFLGVKNRSFNSSANDNSTIGILDTDDPQDIRTRTRYLHNRLVEQTDMYKKVKAYLDEVLMTIMVKNPEILEKSC